MNNNNYYRPKDARLLFDRVRVSLSDFEKTLKYYKENTKMIVITNDFGELYNNGKVDYKVSGVVSVLCVMMHEIALYYSDGGRLRVKYVWLDDDDKRTVRDEYVSVKYGPVLGSMAYRELAKAYHLPQINGYKDAPVSAYDYRYNNDLYQEKKVDAIGYDWNSAFSYQMLNYFLNSTDLGEGLVDEGQVGFNNPDGNKCYFLPIYEGYADHRFMIEEVPEGFKKYVNRWYNRKKEAKANGDKEEATKAKLYLNLAIGILQNHNWALRALYLGKCNEFMKKMTDELNKKYNNAVILCRVDSIYLDKSKLPNGRCPELDALLGTDIGQFKEEANGKMFVYETAYQVEGKDAKWIPFDKEMYRKFKALYGRNFDLSKEEDRELFKEIGRDCSTWKLNVETGNFYRNFVATFK